MKPDGKGPRTFSLAAWLPLAMQRSGAIEQTETKMQWFKRGKCESGVAEEPFIFLQRSLPAANPDQHVQIGLNHGPIAGAVGQSFGKHALHKQHSASASQRAAAVGENAPGPRIVPVVQHALEQQHIGGRNMCEEIACQKFSPLVQTGD
jgi:hypothetical protein